MSKLSNSKGPWATPSQQCRSESRTRCLLRVNTVCQKYSYFCKLTTNKTNLTPLNFQMNLSNGSIQRHFWDFCKLCRPRTVDTECSITVYLQCRIFFFFFFFFYYYYYYYYFSFILFIHFFFFFFFFFFFCKLTSNKTNLTPL